MCSINETHPTNPQSGKQIKDKWKRKALCHSDNILVVEDHPGAITSSGTKFNGIVANHPVLSNASPFSSNLPEEIHAIAHTLGGDRKASTEGFFTGNPAGKKVIVLHVGSTGPVLGYCANPTVTTHNEAQFVWLRATDLSAYRTDGWLDQFLELGFEDAKKLAKFETRAEAHEFEENFPHFLDIIFPGREENLLAFRLLCEAKKECGENATKELNGITIHAPKDTTEWLAPFGESNPDKIEAVAAMIGSGDTKKKVEGVLNAANKDDTTKLLAWIGNFLDPNAPVITED